LHYETPRGNPDGAVFRYYRSLPLSYKPMSRKSPPRRKTVPSPSPVSPRFWLSAAVALAVCLANSGCAVVYRLPTRQGNVIEQKQLDQLRTGMTQDQVHFLLGTPIAANSFQPQRWDYFGYYKPPRGSTVTRDVTLFFDGDKLARIEGAEPIAGNKVSQYRVIEGFTAEENLNKGKAVDDSSKNTGIGTPQPNL